jgi:hypothetical protein
MFINRPVVILASGPSLTCEDVQTVRESGYPVIAINDTYKLAPWADVLYACDARWWIEHGYVTSFEGERWTQDSAPVKDWPRRAAHAGLNVVKSYPGNLVSDSADYIFTGSNSGYQALSFALCAGASHAILLGYDMGVAEDGKRHFFGDHPTTLCQKSPYETFRAAFNQASLAFLSRMGVVNASRRTALECFPRATLEQALGVCS